MPEDRIKIGVSSCLLGNAVRYDGRDQLHDSLFDSALAQFEWVAYCPEMSLGLGVPRPAIGLYEHNSQILLLQNDNHAIDLTLEMKQLSLESVGQALSDICGYIFKSRSPSCGVSSTRVIDVKGKERMDGNGVFAQTLMTALPDMPVIEDTALDDALKKQTFFDEVIRYSRRRSFHS